MAIKVEKLCDPEIDHEFAQLIRERLSMLLRTERQLKGRSIRTLARRLKIRRRHIKAWEAGTRCPPGPIMIKVVQSFGRESFRRLQELDLDLQIMKYNRTTSRLSLARHPLKNPAVIWATRDQTLLAA